MTNRTAWRCAAVTLLAFVLAAPALLADVLTLRDGRRFEGTLVSVRADTVEFEHRGGRDDGRVRRYDRNDVARIEFTNRTRRIGTVPTIAAGRLCASARSSWTPAPDGWTPA